MELFSLKETENREWRMELFSLEKTKNRKQRMVLFSLEETENGEQRMEFESMFKYLDEIKIGKVETKVAMNNSPFLVFTKISYEALISDVNIMDKWPKYVSIKDYDKIYKVDAKRAEVATATNTNELSEDPIQEQFSILFC